MLEHQDGDEKEIIDIKNGEGATLDEMNIKSFTSPLWLDSNVLKTIVELELTLSAFGSSS